MLGTGRAMYGPTKGQEQRRVRDARTSLAQDLVEQLLGLPALDDMIEEHCLLRSDANAAFERTMPQEGMVWVSEGEGEGRWEYGEKDPDEDEIQLGLEAMNKIEKEEKRLILTETAELLLARIRENRF